MIEPYSKAGYPVRYVRGHGRRINDEFSDLNISRERKRQLRMKKRGLCVVPSCGEKAVVGERCLAHAKERREKQRRRLGCKRRYLSKTDRYERALLAK